MAAILQISTFVRCLACCREPRQELKGYKHHKKAYFYGIVLIVANESAK
jgi:hypothetical protein